MALQENATLLSKMPKPKASQANVNFTASNNAGGAKVLLFNITTMPARVEQQNTNFVTTHLSAKTKMETNLKTFILCEDHAQCNISLSSFSMLFFRAKL